MGQTHLALLAVLTAGAGVGCQRAPMPRIATMQTESPWLETGQVRRFEYAAHPRHLARVVEPSGATIELSYQLGRVSSVLFHDDEGNPALERDLQYAGGLLRRIEAVVLPSRRLETIELEYEQERPVKMELIVSSENRWVETFEYDETGRPTRQRYQFRDAEPQVNTEFTWKEDRLTAVTAIPSEVETTYGYDTEGRVVSIGEQVRVEYNGDGLISAVITDSESGEHVHRYTYEDGDVQGFVPTPPIAEGWLFGMDGRPRPDLRQPHLDRLITR